MSQPRNRSCLSFGAAVAIFVIALASAWPARAQWIASGAPVCTELHDQTLVSVVPDLAGGAIIFWTSWFGTTDLYAQRLDSTGVALWAHDGIAVASGAGNQANPMAISDATGGAIVIWNDDRNVYNQLYAQRVGSDGAPLWAAAGIPLTSSAAEPGLQAVISDNANGPLSTNGAIAAWVDARDYDTSGEDVYVGHISSGGSVNWSSSGVLLCDASGDQSDVVMTTDLSGSFRFASGAYVAWRDNRSGTPHIYARRVSAAGAPLWTGDGVPVCTASGGQSTPQICYVNGNAFITWTDYRNGNGEVWAQTLDPNGNALWAPDGVLVVSVGAMQGDAKVISTGFGTATVVWIDGRNGNNDLYAQRMDANGLPMWAPTGVPVCTNAASLGQHVMVSDGAGGVIVCWLDYRPGSVTEVYAQRIDPDGNMLWEHDGVRLCSVPSLEYEPAIVTDGANGAIAAWYDRRSGTNFDVYANRVRGLHGTVDVPPPSATAFRLAVLSSNPAAGAARFALELPRSGPARADVFDLLGRRVRELLDAPMLAAGSHVLGWDGRDETGATACAGIYFVIARSGSESRVVKLVEVR